jgi:hypothetical protein
MNQISIWSHIPNEFLAMKKKDKKSLKKCDIDNKEYQDKLNALRKELKQFDLESWACIKSFFEQFPMVVPVGTQEEALDVIQAKKSLTGRSIWPLLSAQKESF